MHDLQTLKFNHHAIVAINDQLIGLFLIRLKWNTLYTYSTHNNLKKT